MSLSSEGIEYDVSDIKKHSDEFIQKFDELKNLKPSNKISIWSNKIYLDGSIYGTQWIIRKVTFQGRETVKEFLNKNFTDYTKLLQMMIAAEGTIRKLYAKSVGENAVHGSDSKENALIEASFHFASVDLY